MQGVSIAKEMRMRHREQIEAYQIQRVTELATASATVVQAAIRGRLARKGVTRKLGVAL